MFFFCFFFCNQCFFKTSSKAERTKANSSSSPIHRVPFEHHRSRIHTQNALQSVNHEDRNTSEQDSALARPSRRFQAYFHVCAERPPPLQPWIYAQKPELNESCGRQVCAFGSEHNYVSKPSKREGKLHTRTQTHTFLHTHSQSPSFYKNKENIRCCLFSMFYCWAMLGHSFVQSTKYTYNSCILFFYNFQRDVVDSAHCKRQLQQTFICK